MCMPADRPIDIHSIDAVCERIELVVKYILEHFQVGDRFIDQGDWIFEHDISLVVPYCCYIQYHIMGKKKARPYSVAAYAEAGGPWYIVCRHCGHTASLDVRRLVSRFGWSTDVRHIAKRFLCVQCHAQSAVVRRTPQRQIGARRN